MADPVILAFDTSGPYCAAAILQGGAITTQVEDMSRGQGERLMVLLEDTLAAQNLRWGDLDAIGVGTGPGNFTGIRISVSAARGLALALNVPAVGVSMFDTTAHLSSCPKTSVPAPRDQFYFFDPDTLPDPILTAQVDPTAVASAADHSVADHVGAIARIASQQFGQDVARPKPLYVRPADAAPPREKPPLILP